MASAIQRIAIRMQTRSQLHRSGYSRRDINFMLDAADDDVINGVINQTNTSDGLAMAEASATPPGGTGVFATIVQAIIQFLESPQGQALIAALIKLLLGALGHATCTCHISPEAMERFRKEQGTATDSRAGWEHL